MTRCESDAKEDLQCSRGGSWRCGGPEAAVQAKRAGVRVHMPLSHFTAQQSNSVFQSNYTPVGKEETISLSGLRGGEQAVGGVRFQDKKYLKSIDCFG